MKQTDEEPTIKLEWLTKIYNRMKACEAPHVVWPTSPERIRFVLEQGWMTSAEMRESLVNITPEAEKVLQEYETHR